MTLFNSVYHVLLLGGRGVMFVVNMDTKEGTAPLLKDMIPLLKDRLLNKEGKEEQRQQRHL